MQSVLNGSIVAGLMTSLPDRQWYPRFNIFGSTVVSLHAILIAPDNSSAYPQGVTEEFSTYHLSLAVNAAIARVHALGIDKRVAEKNALMEIVNAHTCKDHDQNMFPLPNRRDATGFLRHVLDWGILSVLASGPQDWGSNVGNYSATPPPRGLLSGPSRGHRCPYGEPFGARQGALWPTTYLSSILHRRVLPLDSPVRWYCALCRAILHLRRGLRLKLCALQKRRGLSECGGPPGA